MQAEGWCGQGRVVDFRATFTLEVCLFCESGVVAGHKDVCILWVRQVSTHSKGPPVCNPRDSKCPNLRVLP
jgi:hypothetical protein